MAAPGQLSLGETQGLAVRIPAVDLRDMQSVLSLINETGLYTIQDETIIKEKFVYSMYAA